MVEPLNDEQLAAMETEAKAIQTDIDRENGCDDAKWMHRTFHAYARDVPALLAEVERLRAIIYDTLYKRVPYNGGWVPVTIRDEFARLESENAAMRDLARAIADSRWETYPSGEHLVGFDDALALKVKARALVARYDTGKSEDLP